MGQADTQGGSAILVDELFHEEDDRFLEEVRRLDEIRKLASFADRWKKDPRPWAREQLLAYLDEPLNRPGHHPIIKRIFKHAEETEDHELMAAFMVCFDRSVRRSRKTRMSYDGDSDQWVQEEFLTMPRNSMPSEPTRQIRNPITGAMMEYAVRTRSNSRLFSAHTRYYLRRRAWRYFRSLGHTDGDAYVRAVAFALKRYRDEDFAAGENILDNWGLIHACYQHFDGLRFTSSHAVLEDGRSVSDLSPAPYFPESWKTSKAFPVLLSLAREAGSRLVREWAMELLRSYHQEALSELTPEEVMVMLDHDAVDVQEFGAELLQTATGLAKTPLTVWLKLIETRNPTALAVICDLMKEHVSAERLSLDQMLDLANAAPSPVSAMGLSFLKGRSFDDPDDRMKLATLAEAKCAAMGDEIAGFALPFYESPEQYTRENVSDFFDSLLPEIRNRAWDWMQKTDTAYWDPMLWHRLMETPFPDLRHRIIEGLEQHPGGAPAAPEDLTPLWISSLLDVHRGGRGKLSAVRQVVEAIEAKPERADTLLPIIAVAARSIRGPEQRAGLAAVVTLVEQNPDLTEKVRALLPELVFDPEEALA
jgi:hypothetical protein